MKAGPFVVRLAKFLVLYLFLAIVCQCRSISMGYNGQVHLLSNLGAQP